MWFQMVSGQTTLSRREEDSLSHSRRTSDDPDASSVAPVNHVLILFPRTTLGREDVGDGLVICPPLRALDVLLRRAH